ncbi:unnamed protein product [Arctogadus glacialis]
MKPFVSEEEGSCIYSRALSVPCWPIASHRPLNLVTHAGWKADVAPRHPDEVEQPSVADVHQSTAVAFVLPAQQ